MSELFLQNMTLASLVLASLFAYLYGVGGMIHKAWRRFGCPFCLLAGIVFIGAMKGTFNPYNLISIPLAIGALSLGYGADDTKTKIFKRFYCALAYCLFALPLAITSGLYLLYLLHCVLVTLVVVSLGVWNFAGSARKEETLIGFFMAAIPMFML